MCRSPTARRTPLSTKNERLLFSINHDSFSLFYLFIIIFDARNTIIIIIIITQWLLVVFLFNNTSATLGFQVADPYTRLVYMQTTAFVVHLESTGANERNIATVFV